jgi:phage recombination protein Bet
MKLITDTVARGATPDELKLFMYRCNKMGLDPLKSGQIFFIKYANNPGTIVVGIEGFRSRAARTKKLRGIKRGVIRNEAGECLGAWAKVKRSDWDEPAEVEVSLIEYNTNKAEWAKKPETMIQKVAEAAALRMAFPDELGDAYTPEEMAKTAEELPRVAPEHPGEGNGITESFVWKFTFGKFVQKTIEQVYNDPRNGREALVSYIDWLESNAKKTGKPLSSAALDAISQIENFLGAMENYPEESA